MPRLKWRGRTNKKQGSSASPEEASSTNVFPEPRTFRRGIGSEYAYAVNTLMKQAEKLAGSKNGFLGVDKKELDPVEYGRHSLLPKNFDAKRKKS